MLHAGFNAGLQSFLVMFAGVVLTHHPEMTEEGLTIERESNDV